MIVLFSVAVTDVFKKCFSDLILFPQNCFFYLFLACFSY